MIIEDSLGGNTRERILRDRSKKIRPKGIVLPLNAESGITENERTDERDGHMLERQCRCSMELMIEFVQVFTNLSAHIDQIFLVVCATCVDEGFLHRFCN